MNDIGNEHALGDKMDLSLSHPSLSLASPINTSDAGHQSQVTEWPDHFSLDKRVDYSHQVIGLSSESDPYLLQHYVYNSRDTYPMFRVDFRKVRDNDPIGPHDNETSMSLPRGSEGTPIQFMMTHEEICQEALQANERMFSGGTSKLDDMDLLHRLVPPDLGKRLLIIYARFVHPRFPVLARHDLEQMQKAPHEPSALLGIQSAVYAMAMPFMFFDDELSLTKGYSGVHTETLWAIAYRSYHRESSLAHLPLLQLCLLLLHRPPDNFAVADSPGSWALSCSALAITESLGLNLDPGKWKLPRKEIMLRRRLWWLTYTQHIWHALAFGRSIHLNDDNWDVSELMADDFDGNDSRDSTTPVETTSYVPLILAECQMSEIAADVLKEFYTLKASRRPSTLSELLIRAQPLRKRIETWRQSLPMLSKSVSDLNTEELEMGAFLRLSHIVVEILIFRALLRPLIHRSECPAENFVEPLPTIFGNCYICAKAGTDLVSSLTAKHFASFWPSYARYQVCYLSTFILLCFAHSPSRANAEQNRSLLVKWRDTIRTQSRAWPLARLATIRLDAAFWKGLTSVVHGTGPESPAMRLLKER
ncbi:uncharacterized protein N7459_002689 [Penicillium hispanicum]|uniref:uncharacterized protein n=1 Tax=Penicillium hispanicum TaxID=1080232 RepID=UPI00253FD777|nr:uncharacterized protein N7459_002689 [Penicillium hispanicum]KAJ5586924.1 hypothetical protein N7459_002689 [Penicillium hispanicum]